MPKKRDIEGPIQRSIVKWLRAAMPDAIVHHSKNEIKKSGRQFMLEMSQAKARGMLPGFPDLIVLPFSNVGAFFLEVKAPGGTVQPNQKGIHEHLESLGYRVAVVRSIDDVRDCLNRWGIGHREVVMI